MSDNLTARMMADNPPPSPARINREASHNAYAGIVSPLGTSASWFQRARDHIARARQERNRAYRYHAKEDAQYWVQLARSANKRAVLLVRRGYV